MEESEDFMGKMKLVATFNVYILQDIKHMHFLDDDSFTMVSLLAAEDKRRDTSE